MIGGKKSRRQQVEVNAGSMADVAFLLLIFFLVATTIVNEKALQQILPPHLDEPIDIKIEDRNVLNVIVNNSNQILVEEDVLQLQSIRSTAKAFIVNNRQNPEWSDSPKDAIISIKGFRGTDYGVYSQIYNELRAAYDELRAEELGLSMLDYLELSSLPAKDLKPEEIAVINAVKKKYPLQLSEAEQE
jgi:biopolymer transport protein ExbD